MSYMATQLIGKLRLLAMTVLGLMLAVAPLALWVAWTPEMLLVVVAVAAGSALLLALLSDLDDADVADPRVTRTRARREVLTDESVAELHRLFPLTYHHGRKETPGFRQTMQKVRRLVGGDRADLGR